MNTEQEIFEKLEFPHFVAKVMGQTAPHKLRCMASYLEIPIEEMLRNSYRAEKSAGDVTRDVEHFYTHTVN